MPSDSAKLKRKKATVADLPEEISLFEKLVVCIQQNEINSFKQLIVEKLGLLRKVISSQENEYSFTPTLLQLALASENEEIADFIIAKDLETMWFYSDREDKNMHAAPHEYLFEEKNCRWIKFLCERGADINYRFKLDSSYLAEEQTPLRVAIEVNDNTLVKFLLSQKEIDLKKTFGDNKEGCLHLAAKVGNMFAVNQLIEKGISVNDYSFNSRNYPEDQPIHLAARAGHIEVIDLLLKSGANINATDNWGNTPIHLALWLKHELAANFLLDQGAKLDCFNTNRSRATGYKDVNARHTIHIAARSGAPQILETCCNNFHALVNQKDFYETPPLFYAVASGSLPAVEKLCDHGANLLATGRHATGSELWEYIELNSVEYAAMQGCFDIANYFLKKLIPSGNLFVVLGEFRQPTNLGKLVDVLIELINQHQLPAFECAKILVKYGQFSAVEKLLTEKLVDVNDVNEEGESLLHFAASSNQYETAKFLLDKGIVAKPNKANMLPSALFLVPSIKKSQERKIIRAVIEREFEYIKPKLLTPNQPKWVKDLKVYYTNKHDKPEKSIEIPGDPIHAALGNNDFYLDENLEKMREDENYLTAVLTLVASDEKYISGSMQRKKTITIPLTLSAKDIISFSDITEYEKFCNSLVLYKFSSLDVEAIFNIHDSAWNKQSKFDEYKKIETEEYIFNWYYHHSEQLLLFLLTQKEIVAKYIATQVIENGLINGSKLYAIILDLHSTQYPCVSCKQTLASYDQAQAISHGILPVLTTCLNELDVNLQLPNKGVRMITRVSARKPYPRFEPPKSVGEHVDVITNINIPGMSTLLFRDNTQICPNIYKPDFQANDQIQKFLVATDAELTFFRSGSDTNNIKKRKRVDEGDTLTDESISLEKKAKPITYKN